VSAVFPIRKYLLFASILLCILAGRAQTIRGRVLDLASGKALPFVSILVKGSQTGTLSDIDGKFELSVPAGGSLQLSYLGYEPRTVKVDELGDSNHVIVRLQPSGVLLNEITVIAGENPAHRIIKKASASRGQNNPEKMRSFSYTSYNKFFVTADLSAHIDSVRADDTTLAGLARFFRKQHLFLMESVSARDFLFPGRNKETIVASRVSGFRNSPFALLATQMQSFSFYGDFITVLDQKYLNPISEGSTKKYFFLLEDTLFNGADTVFVISFRPRKNKNFDALKGVLYINTNGYAIQNVIAEPERPDDYTLSITIQQKYERVEGKQWFPVQLNTDWVWKNATVTSKKDPAQRANMKAVSRSYIKDIALNPELKKKQFSEVEIEVAKNADRQEEDFWNAHRADTLSTRDLRTYYKIDSIGKAENLDRKILFLEALFNNRLQLGPVDLNLDKILAGNDYEYIRLGAGFHTNEKLSKRFALGGYAGYGFGDKAWKYGADASLKLWKAKELALSVAMARDLVESGGASFFEDKRTLNSSELYREVYVSVFDRISSYQASLSFRALRYFRFHVYASRQERSGPTQFGVRAADGFMTLKDTVRINEAGVQLKFLYKEKFMQTLRSKISLGSDYPVLYVNLAKGFDQSLAGRTADVNYFKADMRLEATRIFKTIGVSRVVLAGGKVFGAAPYTLLYNNRGSFWQRFAISSANTFETMGLNEFVTSQHAALFFNHNIGRFLKPRKKFNPELELVHSMALGSLEHPDVIFNIPVNTIDRGYFESGLRLLNLVKSGYTTFGLGAFYRYGAYSKPTTLENLAVKLVIGFKF
jgi:hypothetical protein